MSRTQVASRRSPVRSVHVNWWNEVWTRVAPNEGAVVVTPTALVVVLVVAAIVVGVSPVWRVLRLGITLVHELGHAVVGMLCGRGFTGFVLRGDMSGHAVTVGPSRGLGRSLTTWAGYPAPAVVGAGLAWFAGIGWAAPALVVVLVVLLLALIRVRSFTTALVTLVALAGVAALWWWRDDELQAAVLLGAGVVLVVGAWRHLGAVFRGGGAESDPGVLARLTRVPAFLWNASFALVCLAASWVVGVEAWSVYRGA